MKMLRRVGVIHFYVRKKKKKILSSDTQTYVCKGVGNVSFSENFVYVLNGWPHFGVNK